jgi:hypothetical protein
MKFLRVKNVLVAAALGWAALGCDSDEDAPVADFKLSVVVDWNEAMLTAVRNGPARPVVIARSLFVVHNAMYDAWAAYDAAAVGVHWPSDLRRPSAEHTDSNKRRAVSFAAYRALLDQFPAYEQNTGAFTNLLNTLGYDAAGLTIEDTTTPEGVARIAAQAVLDFRQTDGANEANNYAPITSSLYPEAYVPVNSADPTSDRAPGGANFNPNHWQPLRVSNGKLVDEAGNPTFDNNDPSTYTDQAFLAPHWGSVTPFAITDLQALRAEFFPAPPLAGSAAVYVDALGNEMTNDQAYNMQVDEILTISGSLTDRQKVIAEYWADGPRSETPPGHWHALAQGISYRDKHSIDEDVRMYFALGAAVLDAAIAVWDGKRVYDYVRPVSAIRHKYFSQSVSAWGGPNQGTQTISGSQWRPYQALTFVTPPFAEYTSGHSAFSAAAAAVLTSFTGSDRFYDSENPVELPFEDFNGDGLADVLGQHIVGVGGNAFEDSPSEVVVLKWNTFKEAADEAGVSRRYGGIHFQDGDLRSRTAGDAIGNAAFAQARSYWEGQP